MLDERLIQDFRDLINCNSGFILHKHRNQEGKNRWNIICSAMDWISVAVDNFRDFSFIDPEENINKYCIQVYNYISIIDIIYEAICQLHRVITESVNSPFKGIKEVFSNNDEKDDDVFFKHIRAIFGAHPVNLNTGNERWYASWPTKPHFNDYDIQVFLYPLDSNKEDITFGVKIRELEKYAETRYLHLAKLIEHINVDYKKYILKMRNEKILFEDDELKNLEVLLMEHNRRLPNDYIRFMIKDTIKFIGVELSNENNREIYNRFIERLSLVIKDLKVAVQMLDYDEKESYLLFEHDIPEGHHYAFSKYWEVLGGKYDFLAKSFFHEIKEVLKGYVELDESMDDVEQELLIVAALYERSGDNLHNRV